MRILISKKKEAFFINAFHSASRKEFQRIIRDFFYNAHKWQMEQRLGRKLKEEELFVLRAYMYGAMECIYEWIDGGMTMPAEQMVDLLELAMPQMLKQWVLSGEGVSYEEAIKQMEKYLAEKGLVQRFL